MTKQIVMCKRTVKNLQLQTNVTMTTMQKLAKKQVNKITNK